MKKLLKVSAFVLLGIVAFIVLYLFSAFCLSRIRIAEELSAGRDVTIFIKTNGVHTDIVVPVRNKQKDWSKDIAFTNTKSCDTSCNYLGIGWGDKGFYLETPTWADLKASVAFNAAFGLSSTAIHTTYFKGMRESATCKALLLNEEQYARLIQYIHTSFQKDQDGHVRLVNSTIRYGKTDAFYEATGRYSLFCTCNTWANNGLKACGQKCAMWTPFDKGIFFHYQ
jgi:uncharacterized protein (TIGR02117 family)